MFWGLARQDRKDTRLSTARGLGIHSTRYQKLRTIQGAPSICLSTLCGGKAPIFYYILFDQGVVTTLAERAPMAQSILTRCFGGPRHIASQEISS
jgi:hypothetical protein